MVDDDDDDDDGGASATTSGASTATAFTILVLSRCAVGAAGHPDFYPSRSAAYYEVGTARLPGRPAGRCRDNDEQPGQRSPRPTGQVRQTVESRTRSRGNVRQSERPG